MEDSNFARHFQFFSSTPSVFFGKGFQPFPCPILSNTQLESKSSTAAMTSPIQLIEDDDEFDWEAAVREIDDACQASTSTRQQEPPQQPPAETVGNGHNRKLKETHKNSRQSTLDIFISNGASKPYSENPVSGCEVSDADEKTKGKERACYVDIDPEAAKTWIYPDNVPRREYQVAIAKTALFSNTLVALPTGLGKTLIAAVVMYNYFRWFPGGKIVFAAPSRPLVMQQIEACHNIVGIPQVWTTDMTGLTNPPKRASLWKSKRVFFVTPQVLEKDIQSGACSVKYLVCLVIDEAHRAMGNYSYCVAIRELMAVPVDLRILALTATPGSKQQTIQQVIDNLQISTLEYRNEDDHDVCPYIHNRKIELIQVPMGKPAVEIHNLLLEVIRPIAARLSSMALLPHRDFQTLSPCDLLNSRDKFRQAPPPELSHLKYGEVEGFFGVLITLYHIRKLLTSHGIRPAHEMLEEKLHQGYFARYMSRNEFIQRAKLLMEQNLSHGAPSPKLTKMIEVLVDHFKTNDPQNSRVIIFSNFRGSVRDILDSLGNLGNSVKATQFIGQNSGKTLKGQSQKVQQAVLEKFRMGGYNVIVATSIGEEGLDIMEVDLVICFDANISPLRMIQRMGRTGRKHDGRVVVLACEGTELKGYMRKQATGRTVRKHMQNGGMNSFNFHSSPRMVPHFLKPELQFEELSIEKFVRHTKKVKHDIMEAPTFREKLTDAETSLLGKYFVPIEKTFKPSLIAFPHFQAFPSRVHKVMHSSRTGWLIDVMQLFQGLPFSRTGGISGIDSSAQPSWSHPLPTGNAEQQVEIDRDILEPVNCAGAQKEMFNSEVSRYGAIVNEENCTLDRAGRVSEIVLSSGDISLSRRYIVPDSPIQSGCSGHSVGRSQLQTDADKFETAADDSIAAHSPPFYEKCENENMGSDIAGSMATKPIQIPDRHCSVDTAEYDLSPRLTNLIEGGFVPESPLSNSGSQNGEGKNGVLVLEPTSSSRSRTCKNSSIFSSEKVNVDKAPQTRDGNPSPVQDQICNPLADGTSEIEGTPDSPFNQVFRTPPNSANRSCSEDWRMSSGEKSGTGERPFRLKRLRKIGDLGKDRLQNGVKKKATCPSTDLALRVNHAVRDVSNCSKARRPHEDARDFIDVEAEVSSEDMVQDSEDDAEQEYSDHYEDSFIDDRIEPTVGTSQADDGAVDMMAVYRRSLLTQSPFQGRQSHSRVVTPQSMDSIASKTGGECSGKISAQETPQDYSRSVNISAAKASICSRLNLENVTCQAIPSTSGRSQVIMVDMDGRQTEMGSTRAFTLPARNLEEDFSLHSGMLSKEQPLPVEANGNGPCCTSLTDDQFFEGLDLDALEEEATKLLSQRTRSSLPSKRISEPSPQSAASFSSPSFDLGIL